MAENISISMSYNRGRNHNSKYEALTIAACLTQEPTPTYSIIILSVASRFYCERKDVFKTDCIWILCLELTLGVLFHVLSLPVYCGAFV